jgi:hypothetical protein
MLQTHTLRQFTLPHTWNICLVTEDQLFSKPVILYPLLEIHAELERNIVIMGIQCLQQLQPVYFHMKTFSDCIKHMLGHLHILAYGRDWVLSAPNKSFLHSAVSTDGPGKPVYFAAHRQFTLLEFIIPLRNCFVCWWFCVVLGLKPLLHCHKWLSFDKFRDKVHFLFPCPCHVSSCLTPSTETFMGLHRVSCPPK